MSGKGSKPVVKPPKPRNVTFAPTRSATAIAAAANNASTVPKSSQNSNKVLTADRFEAAFKRDLVLSGHHRHHHHRQPTSDRRQSSSSDEYSTTPDPESCLEEYVEGGFHVLDLPENVTETIFTFLPLSDLRTVGLVCKDWERIISDEQSDVWKSFCFRKIHPEVFQSGLLDHLTTYKKKLRAFYHAWNALDCSRNIYVKPNGFTIHRNPVAQSTDGVRGKIGFSKGRHAWEVIWEGPLGTVAVIGIATRRAEMRAQGYVPLLGQDENSWGWNLVENSLLHSGDSHGNFPVISNAPRYQVGERIRVILDCEDNTLAFEKDSEFLGVAFRGLPSQEPLYPAISAVYGNTEVSMVYLGPPLDG